MIMTGSVSIKMIDAISDPQAGDFSHIRKQCQIPVYGAETDVRIRLSYVRIDYICGRMIFSRHQKVFDHLSLPTVFNSQAHLSNF